MDASELLLAARDKMTLRELARRWSPKLGISWFELERAMLEAAISGEFDALPDGTGLLVCDPDSRVLYPVRLELLRADLKKPGTNACEFFEVALQLEWYALHRAAVAVFAEKRGLELPPWWKDSDSEKAQAKDSFPAHIEAINGALSAGLKRKKDVLSHVRKHLPGFSKKLFEDAWRGTPESLKLKQGESLRNFLSKPS
jgi:hypothetical protein